MSKQSKNMSNGCKTIVTSALAQVKKYIYDTLLQPRSILNLNVGRIIKPFLSWKDSCSSFFRAEVVVLLNWTTLGL